MITTHHQCFLTALECTKFVFSQGFAPDLARDLTALPRPRSWFKGPNFKGREKGGKGKVREGEEPATHYANSWIRPLKEKMEWEGRLSVLVPPLMQNKLVCDLECTKNLVDWLHRTRIKCPSYLGSVLLVLVSLSIHVDETSSAFTEEEVTTNSSISNSSDTTVKDIDDDYAESNITATTTTTTEPPQQSTAGKAKRDDGPANVAADDDPLQLPPVPEPQRAAAPSNYTASDVAFSATVQHHVTAFVAWHEPCRGADGGPSVVAVVGYQLRYGNTASSTSTELHLSSNVAAIDGLLPSASYWYQLRYLFDDGSQSAWTGKQLLET